MGIEGVIVNRELTDKASSINSHQVSVYYTRGGTHEGKLWHVPGSDFHMITSQG
jgi:hypothetical protein